MNRIISILVSIFLLLSISSCSKKTNENLKVIHISVPAQVKGMDPINSNDLYSADEVARVYEGLFEYHYLKRPYTLIPNLAESMPVVSDDGKVYTIKIKKGVMFHDDKCFPKGKGRELVAEDFIYSIKRNADPKLQGRGWWVLDGEIVGLNEWRAQSGTTNKTNYEVDIEGLKALDKYTLQFKLNRPFPQFLYAMAMPFYFVVPHEAVEYYGKEFLNHPVGTGPFILPQFNQTKKIVYTKNPNFRDKFFPSDASDEYVGKGLLKAAGQKLPFVDRLEIHIMTESQPRWLKFQKGEIDLMGIPKDNFSSAVTPSRELSPDMKKKGIVLEYAPSLDVTYTAFNNANPLFHNNKDLRRAMSLAYDVAKSNALFYNEMGMPAQSIIPPGIAGYMKDFVNPYAAHDIVKAKKLLALAGYPDGKGLPDITYDTNSGTDARQIGEFVKKCMSDIGINVVVTSNTWPELQKKIATKQTMLHGIAWGADYPDAENFLQLLYGPNESPGSNGTNYKNEDFDRLFEKASQMFDSPERTKIYEKLNKIVAEEVPMMFGLHRMKFVLKQGWLKNYVITDMHTGTAQYWDIDLKLKKELEGKF